MAELEIIETQDGSHSVLSPTFGSYHSRYGAIQESQHVFIEAGLYPLLRQHKSLSILEIGFGTGLNALLTLLAGHTRGFSVDRYEAVEPFPVGMPIIRQLNYPQRLQLDAELSACFMRIHESAWEQDVRISPLFLLHKRQNSLEDLENTLSQGAFDLVYFDAFSPEAQPHLWTSDSLAILYHALKPQGVLVTYCAKGDVKRSLKSLGFRVESIPGPPGKREMIRATR